VEATVQDALMGVRFTVEKVLLTDFVGVEVAAATIKVFIVPGSVTPLLFRIS
jgi:hypothetical protein